MREDAYAKASRYLIESRVRVIECDEHDALVVAEVHGDGRIYGCGHDEHGWFCDCAARTADCAHLRAIRRITVFSPREPQARRRPLSTPRAAPLQRPARDTEGGAFDASTA